MAETILWHDYETNGQDAHRARPLQFACVRTSLELEELSPPVVLHGRLPEDVLPDPEAALVHGITPSRLDELGGTPELALMRAVLVELGRPATCGAGFNSFDFDDEVTRFALWRSLLPAYEREYGQGRSRWDLIDPMRAAYALRPDGIAWPLREDATPSFRLADLAAANDVSHDDAHDALSDVRATIGLARLLRQAQPRLWSYLLAFRHKEAVWEQLALEAPAPLVHVSGKFPASQGCASLVLPMCRHPRFRTNHVVVIDLRHDPEPMLELPVDEVRRLLFLRRDERSPDDPRVPLKVLQVNKAPVIASPRVLDAAALARLALDPAVCETRARGLLQRRAAVEARIQQVYAEEPAERVVDPELALYGGGFVPGADERLCREMHETPPSGWRLLERGLRDPRVRELAFRCRARSYPETLDAAERERWRALVRDRVLGRGGDGAPGASEILERIAELRRASSEDPRATAILDDVAGSIRARLAAVTARAPAG